MANPINTPLTENLYSEREHYAPLKRFTSDGLFMVVHKPLKKIRFLDALAQECVMFFKDKPR